MSRTPKVIADKRTTPVDVEIGRRLRLHRPSAGVSQTQVAEAMGVTFQQVQKYESGTNRIGIGRLIKVAEILDVPLSMFFEGHGTSASKAKTASPAEVLTRPHVLRLVQAFSKIESEGLQLAIVKMAEAVARQAPEGKG
jgi:transcriptional regulator with XRE-family HTH domain